METAVLFVPVLLDVKKRGMGPGNDKSEFAEDFCLYGCNEENDKTPVNFRNQT